MHIETRLYALLRQLAPEAARGAIFVELPEGATAAKLLDAINIPAAKVHMIMINGTAGAPESILRDGDRVGLFPPVGGG